MNFVHSYGEIIEILGECQIAVSDQYPATTHSGDPATLLALCGYKCTTEVDSRFQPNCAKCLAELAMLQDPGNGDDS